mmetsp:Transcript_29477/g.84382  ORF Transcript_29477/g.84382 Transcript_29477/m.84382 type:complete len:211 (+) Transcript_29477:1116-1748(+)
MYTTGEPSRPSQVASSGWLRSKSWIIEVAGGSNGPVKRQFAGSGCGASRPCHELMRTTEPPRCVRTNENISPEPWAFRAMALPNLVKRWRTISMPPMGTVVSGSVMPMMFAASEAGPGKLMTSGMSSSAAASCPATDMKSTIMTLGLFAESTSRRGARDTLRNDKKLVLRVALTAVKYSASVSKLVGSTTHVAPILLALCLIFSDWKSTA